MAEALTVDEIAEASGCFSCFADRFQVLLYLLDQIRIGTGGAAMTTDEIAEAAKCYCFADREAVSIYLLNTISSAVSGGTFSNNISGAGSPVGVVTPDAVNQFYRDTSGTGLWQSTGLTSADWINWI